MKTVRLGRTNVEVSTVGLGSWAFGGPKKVHGRPIGWFGAEEGRVRKSLLAAAEAGINHWDTADVYGDGAAETLLGKALSEVPRDQLFLASKVGWAAGPHSHYYHPQQIRKQLERTLGLLGTDYLDLYYLHHCDFGPSDEHFDCRPFRTGSRERRHPGTRSRVNTSCQLGWVSVATELASAPIFRARSRSETTPRAVSVSSAQTSGSRNTTSGTSSVSTYIAHARRFKVSGECPARDAGAPPPLAVTTLRCPDLCRT